MRIVFIAPSTSQPRILKRIVTLKNAGFDVKVYAYDRGVYNCNALPSDIDVEIIGLFSDGKDYWAKVTTMKKDISKIVKVEGKDCLYYNFGYFGSFYLMLKGVKYVYEMSDVLYGYTRFNLVRPIMKFIDKILVRRSKITIMTSEGFHHYLFGKKIRENVVIQPNKLNSYFHDIERNFNPITTTQKLRFGFIGAIRYPNTILRFARVIGQYYPNHEFHFYGDSAVVNDFIAATTDYKNVIFHGAFCNPVDLESIYANVDIVACCYENESLNERIAEPNKLYEAAFFGKPIIVSTNTFLADQVNKYKCGWVINAYSNEEIRHFIDTFNMDDYKRIIEIEVNMDPESLIDDPYILIEKIKQIE